MKVDIAEAIRSDFNGLNCTFMELKAALLHVLLPALESLNCTFMELKVNININKFVCVVGLNCTFMELKERLRRTLKKY